MRDEAVLTLFGPFANLMRWREFGGETENQER
jgi:hypothetical protein